MITRSNERKMGIATKSLCGFVAMMACIVISFAQTGSAAAPQAAASVAAPSIDFDVVSIKQNKDRTAPRGHSAPANGDGMTFTNVPMVMAILYACRFNNPTLALGLPDWTMVDRYDIAVKVSSEDVDAYQKLTRAQRSMMLRKVLEDRIKLKAHLEPRPTLVYDLVLAKNGPQMKPAKPGDTYPNGFKAAPGQTILFTPPSHMVGQAATAADLANRLSDLGDWSIGRQVFDKTGLTGKYDFTLQWTPEMKTDGDSDGGQGGTDASGPSLFTAVQEQLGLKLDSVKEPVECLIIDHVERPSAN